MMYTVIAVLLLGFLVWFTFGCGKIPAKRKFTVNLGMVIAGVLAYPLVFGYLYISLSGADAVFAEWAWNAMRTFMELSGIPLVIFLFLTCFSAFSTRFDKKFRTKNALLTRYCCCLCCSAAMLLIAPFYSFMTANEQVALEFCVLILGIADALILRCMFLLEKREDGGK
ncbi:MAG: hypothetical protein E7658_06630 [Ruminococcaceae bacterium]|nr:hypothetical protein [Oscillospiraceae bacterium]